MVLARGAALSARVSWLERFYDLVFVACVTRFANELGSRPDLSHTLVVLGWLTGLWLSWFLVMLRLNRFPDEGALTRATVLAQLLAVTVAVGATISATPADDVVGVVGTAVQAAGIAVLYFAIPASTGVRRELAAIPAIGSLAVAGTVLTSLVLSRPWSVLLPLLAMTALVGMVLVRYLPGIARYHPAEGGHAGDRHGQLFLVLLGLSFLKVAFEPARSGGVDLALVVGAFAAGFALWSMYVDGVLPLGFPTGVRAQRRYLVAQFVLALAITVEAAAVTAIPATDTGTVTLSQALLAGASLTAVMAGLAVLAAESLRPARRLAGVRAVMSLLAAGLTAYAAIAPTIGADTFAAALACVIVLAALADAVSRHRCASGQRSERR